MWDGLEWYIRIDWYIWNNFKKGDWQPDWVKTWLLERLSPLKIGVHQFYISMCQFLITLMENVIYLLECAFVFDLIKNAVQ